MNRNLLILLTTCFIILSFAPAQLVKTSLRVTVLDETGNYVEGATITLYDNEDDYHQSQNPVGESVLTNNKGIAKVGGLEAKAYFIDVRKDDKNNNGAGIQTNVLQANRINKVNIIIE